MPSVIVRSRLNFACSQRQHSLGPFECLDLRLLVHADNKRSARRSEVKTDDVFNLLDEFRIATDLECPLQMRLQIVRSENVVNSCMSQSDRTCQRPRRPLRMPGRWWSHYGAHHQPHLFFRTAFASASFRLIG